MGLAIALPVADVHLKVLYSMPQTQAYTLPCASRRPGGDLDTMWHPHQGGFLASRESSKFFSPEHWDREERGGTGRNQASVHQASRQMLCLPPPRLDRGDSVDASLPALTGGHLGLPLTWSTPSPTAVT